MTKTKTKKPLTNTAALADVGQHVYVRSTTSGIGQCRTCGSDDINDGKHYVPQRRTEKTKTKTKTKKPLTNTAAENYVERVREALVIREGEMTKAEYLDALREIASDLEGHIDAAKEELAEDGE